MSTMTSFASEQVDLKEITLVTPYSVDENKTFKNAVVNFSIPGRAVCLPPNEYERMRSRDLAFQPLKEYCLHEEKSETFWQDLGVGAIIGFVAGSLLTRGSR